MTTSGPGGRPRALLALGLALVAVLALLGLRALLGGAAVPMAGPAAPGDAPVERRPVAAPPQAEPEEPATTESAPPVEPAPERAPAPVAEGPYLVAPPGAVLVPGGPTRIGSSREEIAELLTEDPLLRANFAPLVGETPARTVEVDDFFLMVTEVTNEQYAEYVRSTGARPPLHWAEEAIGTARTAFLEEQGGRIKAAREAGEPPPERRKFMEREWWLQNWEGQPWQVPEGAERRPAVYVDYQDAAGYARWAGLRLMTEAEYQRAVRGDEDRPYPWGAEWEDGRYAATSEIRRVNAPSPVGSFPVGASEQGVLDLAGNVWEWTSSPYTAHEGFKPMNLTFDDAGYPETLDSLPDFDPDDQVVVGGSWQNSRFAARCTIRRGTDSFQLANAMGFRCAASPTAGRDRLAAELQGRTPPLGGAELDLAGVAGLDRWRADEPLLRPPEYAVITGYEYLALAPVARFDDPPLGAPLDESEAPRLALAGALSTNLSALGGVSGARSDGGTWFLVLCRATGRIEGPAQRAFHARLRAAPGYSEGSTSLALVDAGGEIAALLPADARWTKRFAPTTVEQAGGQRLLLGIDVPLPGERAVRIEVALDLPTATLAGAWRR